MSHASYHSPPILIEYDVDVDSDVDIVILYVSSLVVTGMNDAITSAIDPTTGNLYIAQADGNIAQLAVVRTRLWYPLSDRPTSQV